MKTGHIQHVYLPAKAPQLDTRTLETKVIAIAKEQYKVVTFKGLIQLIRAMTTAYKSGCDKVYIFFDKINK